MRGTGCRRVIPETRRGRRSGSGATAATGLEGRRGWENSEGWRRNFGCPQSHPVKPELAAHSGELTDGGPWLAPMAYGAGKEARGHSEAGMVLQPGQKDRACQRRARRETRLSRYPNNPSPAATLVAGGHPGRAGLSCDVASCDRSRVAHLTRGRRGQKERRRASSSASESRPKAFVSIDPSSADAGDQ